jgi:hypothetical protein
MPKPQEPRSFQPGAEEDGYVTDDFSRNDREGRPPPAEQAAGDDSAGASADPQPDATRLKATDDADSRDAPPPMDPREGGVR